MSWADVPISVWTRIAAPVAAEAPAMASRRRRSAGVMWWYEAPPLIAPARRRVEGEARVVPVGRVHPLRQVGDDPVREQLHRRVVDPVPGRVVRVAVEAGRRDDDHARGLRDGPHALRPPPQPDRRHLHDRPDPGRAAVDGLLDRAVDVGEGLAGHPGRVHQQVVVGVDDAEPPDRDRTRDADDVAARHPHLLLRA